MGGVAADEHMQTEIPGLLVAGEAVGGANGANRLSGNAITEAFVFGRRAGRSAANRATAMRAQMFRQAAVRAALDLLAPDNSGPRINTAAMIETLQAAMADDVGPLRNNEKLERALGAFDVMTRELGERPGGDGAFDMQRLEWFDLRNMLLVARCVTSAALRRTESRGAHQREDFPGLLPQWGVNQVIRWNGDDLALTSRPALARAAAQ
jgi:succinate dehydrogenase/fumarate reductase flavoprotein subunit